MADAARAQHVLAVVDDQQQPPTGERVRNGVD